jgi:hypothetical protein
VFAVRLDDGREVVLKARYDEAGRASRCVSIQSAIAREGFQCAAPLTRVSAIDAFVVHAEEWRPGGEVLRSDGPAAARQSAGLLADLMARLAVIHAAPPLPNPEWVRWSHDGPSDFPPYPRTDPRVATTILPEYIIETARRARVRLLRADLPSTIGHADWEAQNLRWRCATAHVVHDWDSLGWLPEAAFVGAASGAFASVEIPTLAPLESSEAFLAAYEEARDRAFTANERETAWAASLWPALHNARYETIFESPTPFSSRAVELQAEQRLAFASA